MAKVKRAKQVKQGIGTEWIVFFSIVMFLNLGLLAKEYPLLISQHLSLLEDWSLFFNILYGGVLEAINIIFIVSYLANHKGQKTSQVRNLIEGLILLYLIFSCFIPIIIIMFDRFANALK